MADFLLELFSEEIPARMQPAAARQLGERFTALLTDAGIAPGEIETHATPRRLALIARDLPAASAAVREERRGPRADAPEKAVEGFLKSTGLARDQLEERDDPKGRFLYAVLDRPGQPLAELLAEKLPGLIEAFQWPKSQRWGEASASTASPRWVRPLRAIVALVDNEVVPFTALGVTSGRETFGHRFMGPREAISIDTPGSYADQLRAAYVILSADERASIIRAGAETAAPDAGLTLIPDAGLEAENAGLTEWPVPLPGRFDPEFLSVPREVIQLTMRTNQKYFAANDAYGELAPAFVCVANLEAPDGGETIRAGNERVLSARLADARFFWEQDRKIPLENLLPGLEDRLFFEGMGTVRDKAARLAELSAHLARTIFPDNDAQLAARAGLLAKADLVSATVNEFPEVQGIIGGYIARETGEPAEIATAIAEQYSGAVSGPLSACVSLADRMDSLVAFFARDLKPTGSKDPFALRRAALQIIHVLLDGQIRTGLRPHLLAAGANDTTADELLDFLIDRLKVQQREAGVRHDLIDAVFALGDEDDLVRLLARVRALQDFVETDDGASLLAGYRRATNILRIEEKKDGREYAPVVDAALLTEPAEQALDAALTRADAEVSNLVKTEDFTAAMSALATLRPMVDAFFDDVTVNAADAGLRANRLALLARLRATANRLADFARIAG
ncbi:MAG: glycine--tRNA ligase subunit beta [Sphingomonadaceae bacterium]